MVYKELALPHKKREHDIDFEFDSCVSPSETKCA